MIELEHVIVRFGDREVLSISELRITERRVAVIGANGSGKSTFARLLNGLCLPSEGTVRIDGLDTRHQGREVRRRVGFVFQNPDNQIVFPLVEDDLRFGLKNLGLAKRDVERAVGDSLARFHLSDQRGRQTHTLSGGQKQLLALAGVTAMRPDYIVFDEPTTLLDLRNRNRVAAMIAELDLTAILVTHDLELAATFGRVIFLDEGRIVSDGDAERSVASYRQMMS
jgi:biotin transport system ATP-binding protein